MGAGRGEGRSVPRRGRPHGRRRPGGHLRRAARPRRASRRRTPRRGRRPRHPGHLAAAHPHRDGGRCRWRWPAWGRCRTRSCRIYRDREVGFVVAQTDAEFFCVPGDWNGFDFVAMAGRIAAEHGIEPQGPGDLRRPARGRPATLPPAPTDGDEVRWIYYTSGTTSAPKGVQHTDGTLHGRRPRPGRRARAHRRRRRLHRLPVLPHRRARLPDDAARTGASGRC